jgi:hypothetical protein
MKEEKMAVKDLFIRMGVLNAKDTERKIKGVNGSLSSLGSSALKVGGAFFAAQGIISGFSSVIRLAGQQEKAEAQLNAVLKSTAGVAGLTANELKNMANSLQQVTTFGDEAILEAQSLLLTFTKVGEDVFPQATETILNMSTAMGTDLQSSTVQLGKALNDPIAGIGALSRVGVQLTETQKEQIKKFTEMGDVASAQKVILGELETQFGGLARASAETMAGGLEQMTNAVGDAGEAIGSLLSPMVTKTAEGITFLAEGVSKVIKRFKNFGEEVGKFIKIVPESDIELNKFKTTIQKFSQKELLEMINQMEKSNEGMKAVTDSTKEEDEKLKALIDRYKELNKMMGFEDEIKEKLNEKILITKDLRTEEVDLFNVLEESYNSFIQTKQQQVEQQEKESIMNARLIQQYPELAKKLGLVKTQTTESSSVFKDFKKNIDVATASSVQAGAAITSTSDALFASGEAAKQVATQVVSSEIMKSVAHYIRKFLETTPLPPIISAPLALAGGAAFGSLMGSAIQRVGFADGGVVPGTDRGQGDTVPAMLTPGEVILNQAQQQNLASNMGTTVNIQGNVLGTEEFVRDTLIPEIQRGINLA